MGKEHILARLSDDEIQSLSRLVGLTAQELAKAHYENDKDDERVAKGVISLVHGLELGTTDKNYVKDMIKGTLNPDILKLLVAKVELLKLKSLPAFGLGTANITAVAMGVDNKEIVQAWLQELPRMQESGLLTGSNMVPPCICAAKPSDVTTLVDAEIKCAEKIAIAKEAKEPKKIKEAKDELNATYQPFRAAKERKAARTKAGESGSSLDAVMVGTSLSPKGI